MVWRNWSQRLVTDGGVRWKLVSDGWRNDMADGGIRWEADQKRYVELAILMEWRNWH
jgi:hypothetical protein